MIGHKTIMFVPIRPSRQDSDDSIFDE